MPEQISVGVSLHDYQTSVIYDDLEVPGIRYVNVKFKPFPNQLRNRLTNNLFVFKVLSQAVGKIHDSGEADIFHSFNRLLLNKNKPWIISFESLIPRTWFPKFINSRLFTILDREECRAILAMSENARLHMINRNERHPKLQSVLKKTQIVYPGIHDFPEYYKQKMERNIGQEIHIAFVGNDFFRKGGTIAVSVFEKLRKKYPLKLTVVSTMNRSILEKKSIAFSAIGTVEEWRNRIVNSGGTLLTNLSYEKMRSLMAQVDILLLPTLDDSFGNSIVEAMATGVVNVATRFRAIPEIITHGKDGFLIDVHTTREGRLDASKTTTADMENNLESILKDLLDDPSKMIEIGKNARQSYEKRFTRDCLIKKMQDIYQSAI